MSSVRAAEEEAQALSRGGKKKGPNEYFGGDSTVFLAREDEDEGEEDVEEEDQEDGKEEEVEEEEVEEEEEED